MTYDQKSTAMKKKKSPLWQKLSKNRKNKSNDFYIEI
ncbi:MAG: Unknown protein [uncultured Aureispira sp.]|uniref:Uncharacterized protein n=1 Tax=uncultured Aureispira sp. TaxID=1331704 RepID=A0A6S6ULX9_9BACT|nr:MAG: Unknown protein [uncultured Aureispira sp.]